MAFYFTKNGERSHDSVLELSYTPHRVMSVLKSIHIFLLHSLLSSLSNIMMSNPEVIRKNTRTRVLDVQTDGLQPLTQISCNFGTQNLGRQGFTFVVPINSYKAESTPRHTGRKHTNYPGSTVSLIDKPRVSWVTPPISRQISGTSRVSSLGSPQKTNQQK